MERAYREAKTVKENKEESHWLVENAFGLLEKFGLDKSRNSTSKGETE